VGRKGIYYLLFIIYFILFYFIFIFILLAGDADETVSRYTAFDIHV